MGDEDLARIEALCATATQGPWRIMIVAGGCTVTADDGCDIPTFVAMARTDLPALVAEVEKLRGLLRKVEFVPDCDLGLVCPFCLRHSYEDNSTPVHRAECELHAALEGK